MEERLYAKALLFSRHLQASLGRRDMVAVSDFMAAIEWCGITDNQFVLNAAVSLFARKPEEIQVVRDAYQRCWLFNNCVDLGPPAQVPYSRPAGQSPSNYFIRTLYGSRGKTVERRVSAENAYFRIGREMTRYLPLVEGHRPGKGRRVIDMPAAVREVARDREVLDLPMRGRKRSRGSFLVLIDVSGSMHGLEGWEVSLALSILRSSRGSHVYAISSEYREITDYLRLRSMQGELSAVISSMDTGTAIGPALAGLVREHPEHAEGRHAVVVSDGLDLGDPAKMAEGVRALRMLSRSILWIDPLLDNPGSSVRTDGLLASLPFIDSLVSRRDLLTRPFHEAFRNGVLRVTSYRV